MSTKVSKVPKPNFFMRQYIRYQVISGTYMLTTFESLAFHAFIVTFFVLLIRYGSSFIVELDSVKEEILP